MLLLLLFLPNRVNSGDVRCSGSVVEWRANCNAHVKCPLQKEDCIDCVWSEWSEWSECACTGLQERKRSVLTHNTRCGRPCEGALRETKACLADLIRKDTVERERMSDGVELVYILLKKNLTICLRFCTYLEVRAKFRFHVQSHDNILHVLKSRPQLLSLPMMNV